MSDLLSGTQMQKAAFRRGGEPLIRLLWKPQPSDTVACTLMSKAAQAEHMGRAVAALEWHCLRPQPVQTPSTEEAFHVGSNRHQLGNK